MSTRLSDLPIETLREMLRDTEKSYPGSVSVRILKREIEARERAVALPRRKTGGNGEGQR